MYMSNMSAIDRVVVYFSIWSLDHDLNVRDTIDLPIDTTDLDVESLSRNRGQNALTYTKKYMALHYLVCCFRLKAMTDKALSLKLCCG